MASGMQRHLAPTTLVPAPMGLCSCSSSRMHKPSGGPAPLRPSAWQNWERTAGFCREMVAKTTPWCVIVPLSCGTQQLQVFFSLCPSTGQTHTVQTCKKHLSIYRSWAMPFFVAVGMRGEEFSINRVLTKEEHFGNQDLVFHWNAVSCRKDINTAIKRDASV